MVPSTRGLYRPFTHVYDGVPITVTPVPRDDGRDNLAGRSANVVIQGYDGGRFRESNEDAARRGLAPGPTVMVEFPSAWGRSDNPPFPLVEAGIDEALGLAEILEHRNLNLIPVSASGMFGLGLDGTLGDHPILSRMTLAAPNEGGRQPVKWFARGQLRTGGEERRDDPQAWALLDDAYYAAQRRAWSGAALEGSPRMLTIQIAGGLRDIRVPESSALSRLVPVTVYGEALQRPAPELLAAYGCVQRDPMRAAFFIKSSHANLFRAIALPDEEGLGLHARLVADAERVYRGERLLFA